jgi:hypothetical protein
MKDFSKMTSNPEILSPYWKWYEQIVQIIEREWECTTSDAQGIVDAQDFLTQQSWTKDLTAAETAVIIMNAAS